jgi:predicted site-specific integrase-resolvase
MSTPQPAKRLLPTRQVSQRYGVTPRTVDRWRRQMIIPPPDLTINNRNYWDEEGLDRNDRRRVAERAALRDRPAPTEKGLKVSRPARP